MPLGQMGGYRQGAGPSHLLRPFLAFLQAAHHKTRVGLAALAHNNGNTEPLGELLICGTHLSQTTEHGASRT